MADKVKEAPEAVETANVAAEAEAKKPKKEKEKKKVYKLVSGNKFLTVGSMGVQFFNGKYETTDSAEATALLTIDGVEIVEE